MGDTGHAMEPARLPFDLFRRIVRTGRYLERCDALHASQMWRSVRWYTGNRDVTQVPDAWAANRWLLQLVRCLCDPSTRFVHLETSIAGVMAGSILKVCQLLRILDMETTVKFEPFAPARQDPVVGFWQYNHPRRSKRLSQSKTITHGDKRFLPSYMQPDVVIDARADNAQWPEPFHAGRQVIGLMVQQLILAEYLPKRPSLPSWFTAATCDLCKCSSVKLCIDDECF